MARTYTPEDKQQALDLYVSHGPCHAARKTGIPKPTIMRWAKAAKLKPPAGNTNEGTKRAEELALEARTRIKGKLLMRAEEMLDRMGEGMSVYVGSGATPVKVDLDKAPAGVCKDLATTTGVLLDKYLLLNGEANGRQELSGPGGAPLVTSIVVELPAPAAEEVPDGTLDDQRDGGTEA